MWRILYQFLQAASHVDQSLQAARVGPPFSVSGVLELHDDG
jgi:hypothetical protein